MLFGMNHPIIMNYLNKIFNDKDITKYFIKSIAYGLLMKKQHKVLIIYSQDENNGQNILLKLLDDLLINKNNEFKKWCYTEYNSDNQKCLDLIIKKNKPYDNFNWIVKCENMLPPINIKIKQQISIFILSNIIDEPVNYDEILNQLDDLINEEIQNMNKDLSSIYIEIPEHIQNNIYLIDTI